MDSMGVTALDLGLRGAAAGLFVMMMVVVLVRVRPLDTIKLLGTAMAAGGAAYAIVTAPFVPKAAVWWTLPILGANPVIVWLWARATFDDDFKVRRWHGALWLVVRAAEAMVGGGGFCRTCVVANAGPMAPWLSVATA